MTDRELMQQALEALERCVATCFDRYTHEQVMSSPEHFVNQNITALCARLAHTDEFNPDWDAMAVMVEEQQRMAKRIAALEAQPEQEPVAHTTGHCENHKQKGGCQLHNLQCGWPDCDRKPITAPPQRKPLTDKMVLIAARVMSDRQADACNIDKEDQWKVYGQNFIDDARAMLEAAHGIKENT